MTLTLDPAVRHDLVLLFDVADGNPNGDPDAANQPRIDPETGHGLVTDVCIKRKIRNYVDARCGLEEGTKIFVQAGEALNSKLARAYKHLGFDGKGAKKGVDRETVQQAQAWMCANFYDVRMFGAVLSVGDHPAGKVQGPLQLTFGRSVDPIVSLDVAITRVTKTREDDSTEMGSKWNVPYGLYRMHAFYSAHLAERTGASADDLALFLAAVQGMFDLDRSAARGLMSLRGLYVFSHASKLGEAPSHRLFEQVTVVGRDGVATPRSFDDYEVQVDEAGLPDGVTFARVVG